MNPHESPFAGAADTLPGRTKARRGMKWSFRIARLFGIDIRVHLIFFLIPAYMAWRGMENGPLGVLWGVLGTFMVFTFVVLHELGHSLVAVRHGIHVQDITLLPIGGMARLSRMPENPSAELKIAVAGPLVNLGLVALLLPLFFIAVVGRSISFAAVPRSAAEMLLILILINFVMAGFNFLPAFPLDGGRILRAALAFFLPYLKATRVAVMVGKAFAVLMMAGGLLVGHYWLVIIGLFVFFVGGQEEQMVRQRHRARAFSGGMAHPRPRVRVQYDTRPSEPIVIEVPDPQSPPSPDDETAKAFADWARRLDRIRKGGTYRP